MSMLDKVEYGHIKYIVCVFLNSWISLSMTTSISSSFSSLKDIASSTPQSLKTIKSTPYFKISSLCHVLHFQLFFSLEAKRLKLSTNCSINYSIVLECLHIDKVVLLSSLSLVCLFTSFFWRLFDGVDKFLVLVYFNIFFDFVFSLCFLLIIFAMYNESILQNKFYEF